MVICLERDADLHMAQLMPLPLTVSCFRKIQIGFTFLVPAHLGSLGKRAIKRVFVFVRCLFAASQFGQKQSEMAFIVVIHYNYLTTLYVGCHGSRVVGMLDSGTEEPGFKSQPRHCRVA